MPWSVDRRTHISRWYDRKTTSSLGPRSWWCWLHTPSCPLWIHATRRAGRLCRGTCEQMASVDSGRSLDDQQEKSHRRPGGGEGRKGRGRGGGEEGEGEGRGRVIFCEDIHKLWSTCVYTTNLYTCNLLKERWFIRRRFSLTQSPSSAVGRMVGGCKTNRSTTDTTSSPQQQQLSYNFSSSFRSLTSVPAQREQQKRGNTQHLQHIPRQIAHLHCNTLDKLKLSYNVAYLVIKLQTAG